MTLDIMLPFYGRFDHFRAAVESVIAQTDPEWRLTIVDDVYPDLEPGRWAMGLGDTRVRYIRNESNLGVSRNYSKCVGLMTGEFSVMFGCDDIMLPGYVAQVKALIAANPDAAVLQPGVEVIDGDGKVYLPLVDRVKDHYRASGSGARRLGGEKLAVSLLRGNWTYFPSLVWRVDLLRRYGFHADLTVVQDLLMLLDIAADGGHLVVDDEVVFQYRRHSASVSSAMAADGSRFIQERELFDSQAERFHSLGWASAEAVARRHVSSKFNAITRVPGALAARDFRGARALMAHSLGRRISVSQE